MVLHFLPLTFVSSVTVQTDWSLKHAFSEHNNDIISYFAGMKKQADNHIIKQVTRARRAAGFLGALFVLFRTLPNGHYTIGQKNISATKVFRQYSRHRNQGITAPNPAYYWSWQYFIHQLTQNLEETQFLSELWVITTFKSSPAGSEVLKFFTFLLALIQNF